MIFTNPAGAPEFACEVCGSRWFDRMTDTCYECGAAVDGDEMQRFQEALALFQAGKLVLSPWPDGGVTRTEY